MRDRHLYVTEDAYPSAVDALVERRVGGEPVAYILGEWEFFSLPIAVSRGVLIPRVDTEVLAGAVIGLYRDRLSGMRILDLCAGSGCVGLAVAAHVPFCRVLLADKSPEALKLCRANTVRNRLTRRVSSMELDALEAPPMLIGQFDAIVCNPPYIPTAEIAGLDGSVRDFEPREALDGGTDGLDFYRAVASKWKTVLKADGRLAFECGLGQAAAVRAILEQNGFISVTVYKDTLDIDRVLIGAMKL